jgi:outer membrane immunogenic protein
MRELPEMVKFRFGLFGLTVTSALALGAFSAKAADIYVPSAPGGYKDTPVCCAPTWAGFYAGVNGGYAWNSNRPDIALSDPAGPGFPAVTVTTQGLRPEGGFGGGQIGYNWQGAYFGPSFVFGIEADIQGANVRDGFTRTKFDAAPPFGGSDTLSAHTSEPPRVCRRPFGLSHAAMAVGSIMA